MDPAVGETGPKNLLPFTYAVTIVMLIVGQVQVAIVMEIESIQNFMAKRYYLSVLCFLVSFVSIQLYGFFYEIIATKPWWVRFLAGFWTYETNTISIMKSLYKTEHLSLIVSVLLTYVMMFLSWIYARAVSSHRRAFYTSRLGILLWSERIFVLNCFGIIVCSDMKRLELELFFMIPNTMISTVFVVMFAASLQRPQFFLYNVGDVLLIGHLHYLNCYALFINYVWTSECFLGVMKWKKTTENTFE
ncbi:hypothetical protein KR018_001116 [Drosophila ironensis]|nr:hypothetical protein KR018_001116 [Drosophila ironensis]